LEQKILHLSIGGGGGEYFRTSKSTSSGDVGKGVKEAGPKFSILGHLERWLRGGGRTYRSKFERDANSEMHCSSKGATDGKPITWGCGGKSI